MNRRKFLTQAAVGAAGVAATTVAAPAVHAQKTYNWKMVTTWPPGLPILQTGAERFAKLVEELSGGQIKIQIFAGGELVPPLESFDAVSQGMVQCYHGASYYWAGKHPATQWFTSVPFGMTSNGYNAWFHAGDGMKLYEELYAKFNLVPRPCGATSAQMGGWFNKKINSVNDLKGLKLRFAGLSAKVYSKLGASVVLLPGGEIYTSIERGVIDATDWVGPFLDVRMGLHKVAKYYYFPGWQEPTGYTEMVFNKAAYDALPANLQKVLDAAAAQMTQIMLAEFDVENAKHLAQLRKELNVELTKFPDEVLATFKKVSAEVMEEEAEKAPMARKIHDNYQTFMAQWADWTGVTMQPYLNALL